MSVRQSEQRERVGTRNAGRESERGERRGPRLAYAAQDKNSSSRLNGDLATEAINEDDAVYCYSNPIQIRNLACGGGVGCLTSFAFFRS